MQRDDEFVKNFIKEVNDEIYELVHMIAMKHGLHEDVVFTFVMGLYNENDEGEEDLSISLSSNASEDEEFEQLMSSAIDIYNAVSEDPKPNTIDWWINKYGNGSVN